MSQALVRYPEAALETNTGGDFWGGLLLFPGLILSSVNSPSLRSSSSGSGICSYPSLEFLRKKDRGPKVPFVASVPGLGPRMRADTRGLHRPSPAAQSSSHRGPIVPGLRALGGAGAARLGEAGPPPAGSESTRGV